jgi:nucleoside permease NupC
MARSARLLAMGTHRPRPIFFLLWSFIMNSMKVELAIVLTLLAVSIFTLVNTFTDWVPDVYGIAAMNLLILFHVLWMRKYGDKT